MHAEISRFRSDVSLNPGILAACFDDKFELSSLVEKAQEIGYGFTYEEVSSALKADARNLEAVKAPKLRMYDQAVGEIRDLTEDEVKWVGGAGSTSVYTEGNAVVVTEAFAVVVAAVAAVVVALAMVFLLSPVAEKHP